jgi:hypothetical protein
MNKNNPQQPSSALSFSERHAENMAYFVQILGTSRFWHVLPKGENSPDKATGLLDTESGLLYPPVSALATFLGQHPFIDIQDRKSGKTLATWQHKTTRLLWTNESSKNAYSLADSKKLLDRARWASITGWQLPNKDQLHAFATASNNPYRKDKEFRLSTLAGHAAYQWLTTSGYCDTDNGCWGTSDASAYIFAYHTLWQQASNASILVDIVANDWVLRHSSQTGQFTVETKWGRLSHEQLLATLLVENVHLQKLGQPKVTLDPSPLWVELLLDKLDYTPCRLPILDNAQRTDPEKGLWELWGEPPDFLKRFGFVARDPGDDIQHHAVAIDFGTSSTVVATDTPSGSRELLRIGVRDYYEKVKPQHFENPTVLECLNFSAFVRAWTECAYRPSLDWVWMRAAHEAQASFRDNPGDTRILASILPRLKQWALRADHSRVRLTDREGQEIELAAHTELNPVRGQPLVVAADYPFDPIELYAWYLGMAINWRGRGIFLKYYLSFPVKYAREVRDRILASFRRGLQRSLPQTLITHHPQVLNDFEVNGLASEPAAYAAAAMRYLQIEPTDTGTPYAVFDFGGGTTDFDFGLLRWANAEEEERGYEQVFEHLASDGDPYLGGENLLEHLVYTSFQQNLEVLRQAKIQFTKPLDASPFIGSEAFLAPTQAAQTNTVMLASKLRSFLEAQVTDLPSQIKLDLIDADGGKKTCELVFDASMLDALLGCRIRNGVLAFLSGLARLRPELPANTPIHVLLAGNGSRSRHVKALFDTQSEAWQELLRQIFGETPPEIMVYPPLPLDETKPHAPTAKTGVALGLLHLAPGENTLLLDHVHQRHDGQAPFAWFVGRLRRRQFNPMLTPGVTYGEWHRLGPLQQGVFNLYTTASPRAHNNGLPEGDPELKKHRFDFPAAPVEANLFARATGPCTLELAAVIDETDLTSNTMVRKFELG